MHLLFVENDDNLAEALTEGLQREGFDITWVASAKDALATADVDLVLLDLPLPDMDGYEVCARIQERSQAPVIIIAAQGTDVDTMVKLGANDYVFKPFGFRELMAKIRAVLRPGETALTLGSADGGQHLGRVVIDRNARRLLVDNHECTLEPKEFDLLVLLSENPGAVVTRKILEEIWDPHWYGPSNRVDLDVASLRRKLGHPEWVQTVRGVGWRLVATGPEGQPAIH